MSFFHILTVTMKIFKHGQDMSEIHFQWNLPCVNILAKNRGG